MYEIYKHFLGFCHKSFCFQNFFFLFWKLDETVFRIYMLKNCGLCVVFLLEKWHLNFAWPLIIYLLSTVVQQIKYDIGKRALTNLKKAVITLIAYLMPKIQILKIIMVFMGWNIWKDWLMNNSINAYVINSWK